MIGIVVLIADAQRLFSGALKAALNRRFDLGVLDSRPTTWPETFEAVESLKPDVALIDWWMEGCEPSEGVQRLRERAEECKILVLSPLFSHQQVNEMLAAGAAACLPKAAPLTSLAEAVRRSYRGDSPVYLKELQQWLQRIDEKHEKSVESRRKLQALTAREIEILRVLNSGLPIQVLADQLSVSHETVKAHIRSILKKTGASSQTEALKMARDSGFMQV